LEETKVDLGGSSVRLWSATAAVEFSVIEPAGLTLHRSSTRLNHRNGQVEALYAETDTPRIVYRIQAAAE